MDKGSVEVFINGGDETVTSFAFAGEGRRSLALSSESGSIAVKKLTIHPMNSAWA